MRSLFLTCLVSAVLAVPAWAGPVISFDQPTYDFGTLIQGKKVDHTFVLRNKGDAPLTIGKIKTSCGCTAATISSKTIAPGKTGEIAASFNSASFSGNISKTISVESNDPQAPSTTLTIKGVVTEELSISPRQVSLGNIKADTKKEVTLTVANRSPRHVNLLSVKSGLQQVTVKAKKTSLKPGESAELLVTVNAKGDDRYISGYITVQTDFPSKPEIPIPVYATIIK